MHVDEAIEAALAHGSKGLTHSECKKLHADLKLLLHDFPDAGPAQVCVEGLQCFPPLWNIML